MAANLNDPQCLLPVNVDGIPASMLNTPRWAPWRAVWNIKRQKWDKVPHRADKPGAGLSNKTTKGWAPFHVALAAYLQNPDQFAGVGYLMTGPHGVTGVDLDHCRDPASGEIAPWAAEVVAKLDSYTEISPTGTGLHTIIAADLERDWTNHDRGIEMYGGTAARFLTITGQQVAGSPADVRVPRGGVLEQLAGRYRPVQTAAQVEDLHLPRLLGADELPELEDLDLPPHAKNFLLEGPEPGADRSRLLFATSIALNQLGLGRQVVLSLLEGNEHAMEVALDHRRQDYDKALRYLWKDHCGAGAARADGLRQLQLDQFEDMADAPPPAADSAPLVAGERPAPAPVARSGGVADDFDDMDDGLDLIYGPPANRDLSPTKLAPAGTRLPRFTPLSLTTFLQRPRPDWIIRGLVPRAGLAIIFGASGSGKTFLALDLSASIARGADWRGLRAAKGRVVYVVAEGAGGFRNRVEAYCEAHDVALADLDILVIPDAPNILDKAHIKELVEAIKKVAPVAVIVIDTYARVMAGGNENDAKDTGQAVAHCDLLHRVFKALVVLVHHSGKDAAKGARGSGALRAAADLEIEVIQTREYRAATVTKLKDGEDGKEYAFRLSEVVLGQDDEGFPITSCVVEVRDNIPKAERDKGPKGEIEKLICRQIEVLADLDDGRADRATLIETTYTELDFDPSGDKKDRRKEAIKRAITTLADRGVIKDDGFKLSIA